MSAEHPLKLAPGWLPGRRRYERETIFGACVSAARSDTVIDVHLSAEEVAGGEWAEWYGLTPAERFPESMKLWEAYLALGGSLEPEPDTQSPFFDPEEWRENTAHGRPGVRVLRRGGV